MYLRRYLALQKSLTRPYPMTVNQSHLHMANLTNTTLRALQFPARNGSSLEPNCRTMQPRCAQAAILALQSPARKSTSSPRAATREADGRKTGGRVTCSAKQRSFQLQRGVLRCNEGFFAAPWMLQRLVFVGERAFALDGGRLCSRTLCVSVGWIHASGRLVGV